MFEVALSDKTGIIDWYSVDPEKYNNPGSSGMYMINFSHRRSGDPDKDREPIQKRCKVKASRFDIMNLPAPNLIAMDAEGSELVVLKGFGSKLKEVDAIILESSFSKNYIGGSTFSEIDKFLSQNQFSFARTSLKKSTKKPKISLQARFGFYTPNFNVLYLKNET